ncbi:Rho GTPase-activating protein-like protein [Camelus ferus]|nr:Rho GTPase-activating protein-like protein [Camelus ferus]
MDNKGNHLLVHEESSINTPAVGAAHVIKRYTARAPDELTLEVGDIVSVIDMPPKVLSTWWRGKHGFQVGLFPGHCVELINQKVPQSVTNSVPKPVSKKHGKLITFLRTFMKSRPTKQKLKQRGILKERVFGCDLGEHLLNSGFEVPQVLQSCTAFIERYGIVDGIYRLSGVASNIQRLRHEFDSEHVPDLTKEPYVQDIHSVGSLCKLYFRELPNPLLTYQLYEKFSDAVSAATDEERLIKIHDVIQQLPPPHYRSKQIESACFSGTAAFMEVRIQSVVVEFILNHVDVLFSGRISAAMQEGAASLSRPKSLLVPSPSTKLLTLEEAQARTQAQVTSPAVSENKYIEVGEGPAALQGKFHTVIEFPLERRRPQNKMKKSPVGSWRSFFNLGKSSSVSKRKLQRNESEPSEMKAAALKGGRAEGTLRSAKSEESLTSLHAVDGDSKLFRPRRPRSSSDALSASFNGEMLGNRCNSYDNLPHDNESEEEVGLLHVPALLSPHSAEDVDLSPPDIGVASLDFDPMSFQCSPPKAESECLEGGASFFDSLGYSKDRQNTNNKDSEAGGSQSQTPGSAASSEPVSPVQEKLSPFFTLDLSPTEEKPSKASSFTEKVVYAFSPKIGRKLSRSPSMNISEPISVTLPARVSEVIGTASNTAAQDAPSPTWNKSVEESDVINRPPTQVVKLKASEREAQEGCESAAQPLGQVAPAGVESPGKEEEPASASSGQSKAVPPGQTQTGADNHDPPQDPVPVSSVSLIPPPPPPKNVARLLALALAESAQQASTQPPRRPGPSQAACASYGGLAVAAAEDRLPASHSSVTADRAFFQADMPTEQPHLQDGDQPAPGAAAVGDYTHSCATESGGQPHPADFPGSQPHRIYLAGDPEKAGVTSVPLTDSKSDDHLSFPEDQSAKTSVLTVSFVDQDRSQPRLYSGEQPSSYLGASVDKPHHPLELADKSPTPCNLPRDKVYPPPGSPEEDTSTAPVAYVTTVPTAAEMSTREAGWDVVEQPSAVDFAVATLQRTHRTSRPLPLPPSQRATEQLPGPGQGQAAASVGVHNAHKVRRGGSHVVSMPPVADVKHSYTSWDLEDMEKYRVQSIRRESRARQKVKGPVVSQYDNMAPAAQDDLGGIYVIHLRSKSDPGKTGLLSVAEGKEGRHAVKAVSPEGEDRFYRKHAEPELDRAHPHGAYGGGQPEKPCLPQKQSSLRNRKLHDMGCGLPEHRGHQEASHRQLCESKHGPPYPQGAGQLDYGPQGIPDASEPVSYHNSGGIYVPSGQESLRLNHKEVRLSKELERPRARQPPAPEKHSRDGYKEEEHLAPSVVPPPKPERSHSLKLHHAQSVERDAGVLYQYQPHGKRQGGVTMVPQYDNLEGYHSPPQLQRGAFGAAALGVYVPPGFAHPQSRTYATALGQGAFLPAELALQHPETQIHAE